ncbi:MAG TPA: phosphatidylglycerophosphatase A [Rhizomicrobium sp.]|nr:phosphatidylglycerophosphatase A [Rhizomicrobium sp.]
MALQKSQIVTRIATLYGVGFVQTAPGTVASLVALPLAALIYLVGGRAAVLVCGFAAFAIGSWACEYYVRQTGKKDPSECVVDELAGQWIACAFAPFSILGYLAAFAFFRALDIAKPWPINRLENLHGGFGVMADDVMAGLLAGFAIALLVHLGIF